MTGLEIAVIGMSGRFPLARDIHEFWENLVNGKECISFFSQEELAEESGISAAALDNPDYVRARGSLDKVEYFDSHFFDYTQVEADLMDPQIRFFHELSWQALEDAGYDPGNYQGLIGIYAGASVSLSWEAASLFSGKTNILGSFASSHLTNKDLMCLRVAYKLDLKGPAFNIYTTCSTSLVAVHVACQALLSGECDMALSGGVSITMPQKTGYLYREGMINSPDGHCRAFDAQARGTVSGSGAGVVLLKRLEDAIADKDHIYALVKGSAINNDGSRKVGFTAPSLKGQHDVVRAALQMAGVEAESIGYIEAHGTGTVLGDPIEVKALTRAFDSSKKNFCAIGSVKTNIGHLDAAAGIAGFMKAVLTLKNRLIPPSLHFITPNPALEIEDSPFYVNGQLKEWTNNDSTLPLRAAVSSLGIGGTNAHVILEEWTPPQATTQPKSPPPHPLQQPQAEAQLQPHPHLVLLSAKTGTALQRMSTNLANHFRHNPGIDLADASYTLQVGRKAFAHRYMHVSTSISEAADALTRPFDPDNPSLGFAPADKPVVFMFPGQGAQYENMGAGLYANHPTFRAALEQCFEILQPMLGFDIKHVLYPPCPPVPGLLTLDQTAVTQPIIFIFEYALAQLFISWGIAPDMMIGHSIGEYTAACLSGVFSLADALSLVVARGRLMQQMQPGDMLGISLPAKELEPLLASHPQLSLAAVNSPITCVVSGPPQAVAGFALEMKEKDIQTRPLHTSHAFHSAMMEPMLDSFKEHFREITLSVPQIPFISNVSGKLITPGEAQDPAYWVNHLRSTVRFCEGCYELLDKGQYCFIEVGPGRTLSTFLKHVLQEQKQTGVAVVNLVRHPQENINDDSFLLPKIGNLWLNGVTIDWPAFHAGRQRYRLSLPTYSFDPLYHMLDMSVLQRRKKNSESSDDTGMETSPVTTIETAGSLHKSQNDTYQPVTVSDGSSTTPGKPAPSIGQVAPAISRRSNCSTPYEPPQDEIELAIAAVWEKLFGLDKAGARDDFFELGGDSLQAMNMIANIHAHLRVKVPLDFFFANPTIRGIAQYVAHHAGRDVFTLIEPLEKREYYELFPPQHRLLYLHRLLPQSTNYNLYFSSVLSFDINKEVFIQVFRDLLRRHESLRTSFQFVEGRAVQRIHEHVDFDIEYYETGEDPDQGENTTLHQLARQFIRPFNLEKAPLLRAALIKVNRPGTGHSEPGEPGEHGGPGGAGGAGKVHHVVMVDMHHIISDGISLGIIISDLMALARRQPLSPLTVQFKDYAHWYNRQTGSEWMKRQENYWLKQFETPPPQVDLPTDFERPEKINYQGRLFKFEIPPEVEKEIRELVARENATLFMVLLTAFFIFLYKLTGLNDIVLLTIFHGRNRTGLERVVGMFANTIFLRNYPQPELVFCEFLREVRQRTLDTFENQDYQVDGLIEKLNIKRELGRNPVSDIAFMMLKPGDTAKPGKKTSDSQATETNQPSQDSQTSQTSAGTPASPDPNRPDYNLEAMEVLFDLGLIIIERNQKLSFRFGYFTSLFKDQTIARFAGYYQDILKAITIDPGIKLKDIRLEYDLLEATPAVTAIDFDI